MGHRSPTKIDVLFKELGVVLRYALLVLSVERTSGIRLVKDNLLLKELSTHGINSQLNLFLPAIYSKGVPLLGFYNFVIKTQ
jgi:hypothetical protein